MNTLQSTGLSDERVKISEILTIEYKDFQRYCDIAGKVFRDELTSVDYVAYRSQYGRTRDEIKILRTLIEEFNETEEDSSGEQEDFEDSLPELNSGNNTDEDMKLDKVLENAHALKGDIQYDTDAVGSTDKVESEIVPINKVEGISLRCEEDTTYASALDIIIDGLDEIKIDEGLVAAFGVELSIRSLNALCQAGCITLENLFLCTPNRLKKIKNLGTKSLHEIENAISVIARQMQSDRSFLLQITRSTKNRVFIRTDAVKKAFQNILAVDSFEESELTNVEIAYLRKMQIAKDDIGIDVCTLLLEEDEARQYVRIISEALGDFCHKTSIVTDIRNHARRCIGKLSEDVLSSPLSLYVLLYLKAISIELDENMLPFMEDNILVRDFASITERVVFRKIYSRELDYKKITELVKHIAKFGNWLSEIDINNILCALFDFTNLKEQRMWDVFKNRVSGMTLETIALAMGGLTRERVRQIEKKALHAIKWRFTASKHNIFGLISVLKNGDSVLQKHELEAILGEEYTELLWYCLSHKDSQEDRYLFDTQISRYDDRHDLVVVTIGGSKKMDNSKDEHSVVLKFIEELPTLLETELLEKKILEAASEQGFHAEICRIAANEVYKKAGKFSYKGRLTTLQMCDYILKNRFQNGYKIADETDSKMFLQYMGELFSTTGRTTARAIDAKIMDIGVLFDRGKYIHSDYIHIDQSVVDAIFRWIDDSPRSVLTYMEIFAALRELFAGTPITNRYILQGVIKLYNCKYESHKDYITKEGGGNVADELTAFIQSKGIVHKSEVFEEFPGWKDYNLSFVLPRCPEIISIDMGYFMHSSLMKFGKENVNSIRKYLLACVNDIPVSARYLYDEFMIRFSDFMIENDIQTYGKLFGILQYMYKGEFHFSRPYIARENVGEITNKSVLLQHIEGMDSIEIEDFIDICKQNAVHYVSISYLLNIMQPELIRVDVNTLMKCEKVGLTEEIVQEVADLINESVLGHGGYIASKTIEDFSWYPSLEVPWTPFLLESVATMIPTGVNIVMSMSTSMEFPHAIFVSEEYEDDDWNSLIIKVLKIEHNVEPFRSKKDIFEWLQKEGLCNVNFPAFLETEHHVYEDESGRLVVE